MKGLQNHNLLQEIDLEENQVSIHSQTDAWNNIGLQCISMWFCTHCLHVMIVYGLKTMFSILSPVMMTVNIKPRFWSENWRSIFTQITRFFDIFWKMSLCVYHWGKFSSNVWSFLQNCPYMGHITSVRLIPNLGTIRLLKHSGSFLFLLANQRLFKN